MTLEEVLIKNNLNLLLAIIKNDRTVLNQVQNIIGEAEPDSLTEKDIANLRDFEKSDFCINFFNKTDKHDSHRMRLDWFILGFAFLYLISITFLPLTDMGYRVADTILGVVIGVLIGSIMSFWYDGVAHKKE